MGGVTGKWSGVDRIRGLGGMVIGEGCRQSGDN